MEIIVQLLVIVPTLIKRTAVWMSFTHPDHKSNKQTNHTNGLLNEAFRLGILVDYIKVIVFKSFDQMIVCNLQMLYTS